MRAVSDSYMVLTVDNNLLHSARLEAAYTGDIQIKSMESETAGRRRGWKPKQIL